jgi:septum site-determining protein MinC
MDVKNSVVLKSFPNGISIHVADDIPYEQLLNDIAVKFREADSFLKNASVVISIEGRKFTSLQEREILDTITENSHLKVLCITGNDEEQKLKFAGIQESLTFHKEENFGQFYKGSLKNGQSIETEQSIIILGDVSSGCNIYSNKDIVVLGTLAGSAYAGAGGNSSHFVAALGMAPEMLRIGDYSYKPPKASHPFGFLKFGKKDNFDNKNTPMIAYVYKSEINLKPITKELLDGFTL